MSGSTQDSTPRTVTEHLALCRDVLTFSPVAARRAVFSGSARLPLAAFLGSGAVAYSLAVHAELTSGGYQLPPGAALVGTILTALLGPAAFGVLILVAVAALRRVVWWIVPGGLQSADCLRLLSYGALPFTIKHVVAVPLIVATGEPYLVAFSREAASPLDTARSWVFWLWAFALLVVGLVASRHREEAGTNS